MASSLNTHPSVTFDLNLTDGELVAGYRWDNSQDVWSSERYWACLLVSCYQPDPLSDADPDKYQGLNNSGTGKREKEEPTLGATPETPGDSDNASAIFLETIRDVAARQYSDLAHVIAHEIGHSGGPNNDPNADHAEYGLMRPGGDVSGFLAPTLKRFREATKW